MPKWVEEGWHEYAKRLPSELALELVEIPLNTRGKNADVARFIRQEGEAMLAKVGPNERIVTLEVHGKPWSTEQLAVELDRWRLDSRTVNFMVGGPEGLAPEVCARADQRWSLSPLTLPHPLVRILIGEQLYRAWTVPVRPPLPQVVLPSCPSRSASRTTKKTPVWCVAASCSGQLQWSR